MQAWLGRWAKETFTLYSGANLSIQQSSEEKEEACTSVLQLSQRDQQPCLDAKFGIHEEPSHYSNIFQLQI